VLSRKEGGAYRDKFSQAAGDYGGKKFSRQGSMNVSGAALDTKALQDLFQKVHDVRKLEKRIIEASERCREAERAGLVSFNARFCTLSG